jgi:PBP1b-binding outer membrane lipoprotein LpoB
MKIKNKNLIMKKIYILLIVFLFTACNTTKKVQEVKEDVKTEIVADTKEKKVTDTEVIADLIVDNKDEECVYEPIDENTPMVINGIVYKNTKIKKVKKNTKAVSKEVTKKKDTQLIIKKAIEKTTKASATKNLDKTSKPNVFVWWWWLLLVAAVVAAYRFLK